MSGRYHRVSRCTMTPMRTCDNCGIEFEPSARSPHQRFHNSECRVKFHRQRTKQARLEASKPEEVDLDGETGANLASAVKVVDALKDAGRVEDVDDAKVVTFLSLAQSVDRWPNDAALWGQYRQAEATVQKMGAGEVDEVQALIDEINAAT